MKPKRSLSVVVLCFFLMVGLLWEVGAFSEEDLEKLKALGSCPSCDLSNANLRGANLFMANLRGADLTNANLTKAKLENAENFNTADTTGAIFCRTIMPDASLNKSGC